MRISYLRRVLCLPCFDLFQPVCMLRFFDMRQQRLQDLFAVTDDGLCDCYIFTDLTLIDVDLQDLRLLRKGFRLQSTIRS